MKAPVRVAMACVGLVVLFGTTACGGGGGGGGSTGTGDGGGGSGGGTLAAGAQSAEGEGTAGSGSSGGTAGSGQWGAGGGGSSESGTQSAGSGQGGAASIVGSWTCEMFLPQGTSAGQVSMTFDSNGVVVMNGASWTYVLTSGEQLLLSNGSGQQDAYQVDTLTDSSLGLRYGDGSTFVCQRGQGGATAGSGSGSLGAGGETAALYGWFCTFSGSSIGGTYGELTGIYFDGQGNWSMGGETYSSGSAGTYYGSGAQDSGTYSVQGNTIYYTISSGGQGTAQVYVRQPTGEITEIMVEGTVYGKSVCNP